MISHLFYETPIIESNEYPVRETYRCLEEKVKLLNIEIIAMDSFKKCKKLMLWQSRKDLTLQELPCNHKSEIARLTEEITYAINEQRTKSCIIK